MSGPSTSSFRIDQHVSDLREVGALCYKRGWSLGTSSNYSVVINHNPLELLVTASGKDKGRLTPSDFVRVDGQGQPVLPDSPKPSAETLLHVALALQPDVGAILHTHSVSSTLLSDLYFPDGGFHIEGYEMLKGLAGIKTHETSKWVEIFENTQDIPSLARQIEERQKDIERRLQHVFLIRRHGLYTWGRDLDEARRHVEILEFLLDVVARRLLLTGAVPASALDYSS